jgi:hypothetical protein
MKFVICFTLFLICFSTKAALPSMKEILLLLPDSAFRYSPALTETKTFSKDERLCLWKETGSSVFRIDTYSDSLHELQFSGGDYVSVQLKYWVRSKNEIYIAVIESNCDFVMCSQKNSFYLLKKGKLKPFSLHYFSVPMKHFFSEEKLKACGFDPEEGCTDYTLSLENEGISVHFQVEFLDSELMGKEGKYVCLENSKISISDVFAVVYVFNRKEFTLKTTATN